jgi:hypothetical protein
MLEQHTFAGTAFADDGGDFTFINLQIDLNFLVTFLNSINGSVITATFQPHNFTRVPKSFRNRAWLPEDRYRFP